MRYGSADKDIAIIAHYASLFRRASLPSPKARLLIFIGRRFSRMRLSAATFRRRISRPTMLAKVAGARFPAAVRAGTDTGVPRHVGQPARFR